MFKCELQVLEQKIQALTHPSFWSRIPEMLLYVGKQASKHRTAFLEAVAAVWAAGSIAGESHPPLQGCSMALALVDGIVTCVHALFVNLSVID